MTLDADRIRAAVEQAKALGWQIAPRRTLQPSAKRCCPMGALALSLDPEIAPYMVMDLLANAGFSPSACISFAAGFDGDYRGAAHLDAYDLGVAFRRELLDEAQS